MLNYGHKILPEDDRDVYIDDFPGATLPINIIIMK